MIKIILAIQVTSRFKSSLSSKTTATLWRLIEFMVIIIMYQLLNRYFLYYFYKLLTTYFQSSYFSSKPVLSTDIFNTMQETGNTDFHFKF